ncbi:MAG: hypothetical protein WC015_10750, partial [Methanoregula sp.]
MFIVGEIDDFNKNLQRMMRMKRQLPYATIMIFILVVLCINIVSAASLPGNTLCITNASGIAPGETATVGIYLNNSFNPKAG